MPPSHDSAAITPPDTAASCATSTCQYRASPPASLMSATVALPAPSFTSKTATRAP